MPGFRGLLALFGGRDAGKEPDAVSGLIEAMKAIATSPVEAGPRAEAVASI
jgi:hypothetical protein